MNVLCRAASTGIDGLKIAQEITPDLILMDIQLPDMTALEVVEKLRSEPFLTNIPIIALTACAMKGDGEKFISAGCDAYLAKPFNVQELMAIVRKFLKLEAA